MLIFSLSSPHILMCFVIGRRCTTVLMPMEMASLISMSFDRCWKQTDLLAKLAADQLQLDAEAAAAAAAATAPNALSTHEDAQRVAMAAAACTAAGRLQFEADLEEAVDCIELPGGPIDDEIVRQQEAHAMAAQQRHSMTAQMEAAARMAVDLDDNTQVVQVYLHHNMGPYGEYNLQ